MHIIAPGTPYHNRVTRGELGPFTFTCPNRSTQYVRASFHTISEKRDFDEKTSPPTEEA